MIIPGANRKAAKANWVQSGLGSIIGEEIFQYGGIHFNTEYPVLNDQAEHNTGEQGNNIYGDKIKCPGTPLVPGAAVCVHVEGGGA